MPTTAFSLTSAWTKAADGPNNVLIPAIREFTWAVTTGSAPALAFSVCPVRVKGSDLSITLAAGESLYVGAHQPFATTVTIGA